MDWSPVVLFGGGVVMGLLLLKYITGKLTSMLDILGTPAAPPDPSAVILTLLKRQDLVEREIALMRKAIGLLIIASVETESSGEWGEEDKPPEDPGAEPTPPDGPDEQPTNKGYDGARNQEKEPSTCSEEESALSWVEQHYLDGF